MKKNLKKRAVGVTVALVMAASVVACGAKDSGETNSVSASESSDVIEDVVEESAENESPETNDDDEIRETISGAESYYVKIISLDETSVTFLNLQADDEKYAEDIRKGTINDDNWEEYAHTYKLSLSSNVYFDDEVSAGDNAIIYVVDDQVYNFCLANPMESFTNFDF